MKAMIWKYLGAMMTEKKDGSMAASFTRVLGVLTFLLWIVMVVLDAIELAEMPDAVTYVLIALVMGKSAKDFGKALKGHSSYTSPGE